MTIMLKPLMLGGLMLGMSISASAAGFVYTDFSDVSGLQLNGNAIQNANVLQLTPSEFGQSGSAFTLLSTPLGELATFSTYFQFRISNSNGYWDVDGPGADGLVFVIQPLANNVGGAGGGIGYYGIGNSLGIEFDTWQNGEFNDPNGNHVGVDLNGNLNSVATAIESTLFNNGNIWNAWIEYDGTNGQLDVRWSQDATRPVASQLSYNVDLLSVLGSQTAYIGFTSGTGYAYNQHDILSWQYSDTIAAVPEPSEALLLSAGTLLLAGWAARRRQSSRS